MRRAEQMAWKLWNPRVPFYYICCCSAEFPQGLKCSAREIWLSAFDWVSWPSRAELINARWSPTCLKFTGWINRAKTTLGRAVNWIQQFNWVTARNYPFISIIESPFHNCQAQQRRVYYICGCVWALFNFLRAQWIWGFALLSIWTICPTLVCQPARSV